MRERLIELLMRVPCGYDGAGADGIADYLIANGVTIQKRGEWVDVEGNPVPFDEEAEGCPVRSCYCNVCDDWLTASDEYAVRGWFCPNCGANMGVDA